jgi:amino acid transporter
MSETGPSHAPERKMRWTDGFVLSLTMPAALIAALGYSIGALGAWTAIFLWGVSMVLATVANWIYSEMAAMFPDTPGGIPMYAHEGWRSRMSLVAPLASFGYWFAWTTAVAVFGLVIGSLVQATWFPGQDWSVSLGLFDLTFPLVVALGVVVLLWAVNYTGVEMTMRFAYVTGGLLLIPLFVFIFLPYVSGDWSASNLSWNLDGGSAGSLQTALVWLYVMAWTSFGVEVCATFTPEYRNGARDTARALKAAALFALAVFILLPLGVTGVVGEAAIAKDPVTFYVQGFEQIVGGATDLMVACIIASLLLIMNTAMADGSRALYGMSTEGVTIKQFGVLNRNGVPGRAVTLGLIVNVSVILFIANPLAIVATGNLGYLLAHVFALSAFVLLRRDRPGWLRPILLPRVFVPIAAVMALTVTVMIAVGASSFSITGYGGTKELVIAFALLGTSVLLYAYRRRVQDGERVSLREPHPQARVVEPEAEHPPLVLH